MSKPCDVVAIYQNNKSSVNGRNVLKLVDIVPAEINGLVAKNKKTKYKGQKISVIDTDFNEYEFLFYPFDISKVHNGEELLNSNPDKFIERALDTYKDTFYWLTVNEAVVNLSNVGPDDYNACKLAFSAEDFINFVNTPANDTLDKLKNIAGFDGAMDVLHASSLQEFLKKGEILEKKQNPLTSAIEVRDAGQEIKKYNQIMAVSQIYDKAKEIIFGQDEQLKKVIAGINMNRRLIEFNYSVEEVSDLKNIMLLIGETGTGKTLIIQTLAKLFNLPYIIVNATDYTKTGYEGGNVTDILVQLLNLQEKDIKKAQEGIIIIDEIDKICTKEERNNGATTIAVQQDLLKMLEGCVIRKRIREGFAEREFVFDTSKITFVLSGAFDKLCKRKEIINKDDLIDYGMIPEFASRINILLKMNKPTIQDLKDAALNSKRSYLRQMVEYLKSEDADLTYIDEYIEYVASLAYRSGSNYRGVKERISMDILDNLFDIYSGDIKALNLIPKKEYNQTSESDYVI